MMATIMFEHHNVRFGQQLILAIRSSEIQNARTHPIKIPLYGDLQP